MHERISKIKKMNERGGGGGGGGWAAVLWGVCKITKNGIGLMVKEMGRFLTDGSG